MTRLRIITAGESHGPVLTGIMEGLPAGLTLNRRAIDDQLARRQKGYGRGGRMKIEQDKVEITAGLRFGKTTGAPLCLNIENRDWKNWRDRMGIWDGKDDPMTIPRPGHADLAGALKYGHTDLRNILERASARETAMRTALGAVARQLLAEFGIWIGSHVIRIGAVESDRTFRSLPYTSSAAYEAELRTICAEAEPSPVRCAVPEISKRMVGGIEQAAKAGDSLGGICELTALGVPAGLGSHVMWDRRLDAALAAAVISVPGLKSVEIGLGLETAGLPGSQVHDPILSADPPFPERTSNHAGGIEGGISNGQPLIVRTAMKPIPTLTVPLKSVNINSGNEADAHRERSDTCAVPAASVVAEAMLGIVLADALIERTGGDTLDQIKNALQR